MSTSIQHPVDSTGITGWSGTEQTSYRAGSQTEQPELNEPDTDKDIP